MALTVNPPARVVLLVVSMVLVLAMAGAAIAQPAATTQGPDVARQWADLIHGIRVAQPDLAKANAAAILQSDVPPKTIYELYTATENVEQVLTRGEKLEGLAEPIAQIRQLVDQGFQDKRSDPVEIARAIEMLPASPRSYQLAASRLERSGEYAMPQLIQVLGAPETPARTKEAIITVLPRLGPTIVRPLTMVLQSNDPQLIQVAATVLGQLQYPSAAPYLAQLLERPGVLPRTQDAARAALMSVTGSSGAQGTVAQMFYDLASKYYYGEPSIVPAEGATANVWTWREGLGLDFVPVPREIFDEIYAMRLTRQSLELDPQMHPAVSLWLAARLRKAIQLPEGTQDPTAVADEPTAEFYALAVSAAFMQDVLARALKDNDPQLASAAIEALSQTAGAKSLVQAVEGGVQPLVAALGSGDRGVRFLAALTLARALPAENFAGQDQVVRVLGEMLRLTSGRRALVMIEDQQLRNQVKDLLRSADYQVFDEATADAGIASARKAGGVDLVVLSGAPGPAQTLARLRQESLLAATPVLVVGGGQVGGSLANMPGVSVLEGDLDAAKFAQAAQSASQAGQQPLDAEQATQWTLEAADALWLLGMTGNKVYDVSFSLAALTDLLADERSEVKLGAARALSVVGCDTAQQAVASLALEQDQAAQIQLAAMDLLGSSVRRFGNLLTPAQSQAIVNLVVDDAQVSPELRNAAAAVMGSLNLPSDQIKSLILETAQAK